MKFLFTWQRFGRIGRRSRQTLQSLPIILALLSPRPALSAEAINITLRSIAFDIPLMDLETFAKTGQISPELGFIEATLTPAQIASLRSLLQESLDLDATIISQFLALPEGDILLARLGSLVAEEPGEQQTEAANPVNQQTGAAQLREALLAAAVAPEGLSLINLVRQFPAERLSLDVEQVLALINENADFYARRPAILQALQAEANQHRLPLPPGPLEALDQPGKVAWRRQPMTFRNPERASFPWRISIFRRGARPQPAPAPPAPRPQPQPASPLCCYPTVWDPIATAWPTWPSTLPPMAMAWSRLNITKPAAIASPAFSKAWPHPPVPASCCCAPGTSPPS
ncbi:MAG: alpha/beta hydrolase [Synechococcales cyanobacterium RM1_1_8]|nr:alpha/beta hydrolase [Synechococcales cyanobacterium RM1_1_8]